MGSGVAVTVAEIAGATDVAVGMVFNYFPSKEAMLFDGTGDPIESMVERVRNRAPTRSVVAAL